MDPCYLETKKCSSQLLGARVAWHMRMCVRARVRASINIYNIIRKGLLYYIHGQINGVYGQVYGSLA